MKIISLILSYLLAIGSLAGCTTIPKEPDEKPAVIQEIQAEELDIPAYSGSPYVVINGNTPYLTVDDSAYKSYETYSPLDTLGRCGVCIASIGTDIMPTEERGSIGSVKPTGWQTAKYDFVDGKYLYNRCHLIGFQLTGENANTGNLITGTRSMNTQGMLPFENMVADYVKETKNHVLYRVTPVFEGDNLVASGVLMEAVSVEDEGRGIMFCVYCYNVEPGVVIDYKTGKNWEETKEEPPKEEETENSYILNTSSKKFHYPSCYSVSQMSEKNKQAYTGTRESLVDSGYSPCGNCKP